MKNLLMMLALIMSIGIMSCDDQTDTTPVQETTNRIANSRLRVLSSDSLNTSNMDTWTELTASELPSTVSDYLAANFPGVNIEEAWQTDSGQIVILLENDIVLLFNGSGELIFSFDLADYIGDDDDDDEYDDWTEIDVADLPQAIKDYVAANYADATIEEAWIDEEDGSFIVLLDTDIILVFDKDGNFLEELDEDDFDDDDSEEIDPEDLPQAIKDYIAANYADQTIDEAEVDTETGNIYVYLDNGLVVVFDSQGNFIEAFNEWEEDATQVAVDDLPQAIKDYVATNYADQTIVEAWFADEDKEFYVILDNDLVLLFDEAGNFIEIVEC